MGMIQQISSREDLTILAEELPGQEPSLVAKDEDGERWLYREHFDKVEDAEELADRFQQRVDLGRQLRDEDWIPALWV